jgi:pyruvate,orthophosphate dikinase
VSRELGRPCVVGCGANTVTALAGQRVTLDGSSGRIWTGELAAERAAEASSPDLRKLLEWGLPLAPIQLVPADAAAEGFVDLDRFGDDWRAALAPGAAVRGRVLDTDEGIGAAMAAGVRAAAVHHRLPALLACLAFASEAVDGGGRVRAVAGPAAGVSELTLLRLVGLKGRASAEVLGESLSLSADAVTASYQGSCDRGLCARAGPSLRLTPAGRARVAELLAEERAQADRSAVAALYQEFCGFNAEVKEIMTAWQLKREGVANDHQDPGYDHAVLQRLADLHRRVNPLLQRLGALAPRLAAYAVRLDRAAERIGAGDHSYVARLIADSYHTVWFELHEDLISLAGLTREATARGARPGTAIAG